MNPLLKAALLAGANANNAKHVDQVKVDKLIATAMLNVEYIATSTSADDDDWLPVLRYALDSAEEAEAVTRVESMLVEAGIKIGHDKPHSNKRDMKHSLDVEVGSVRAAAKRVAEQC